MLFLKKKKKKCKKSPFITKQTHQFINCNNLSVLCIATEKKTEYIFFEDNNYARLTPINYKFLNSGIFTNKKKID